MFRVSKSNPARKDSYGGVSIINPIGILMMLVILMFFTGAAFGQISRDFRPLDEVEKLLKEKLLPKPDLLLRVIPDKQTYLLSDTVMRFEIRIINLTDGEIAISTQPSFRPQWINAYYSFPDGQTVEVYAYRSDSVPISETNTAIINIKPNQAFISFEKYKYPYSAVDSLAMNTPVKSVEWAYGKYIWYYSRIYSSQGNAKIPQKTWEGELSAPVFFNISASASSNTLAAADEAERIIIQHNKIRFNKEALIKKQLEDLKYSSDNDAAMRVYAEILKRDPKNAWVLTLQARALQELKRYNEALEVLTKALNLEPKNSDIWFDKGTLLFNLKRYDEAAEVFGKVIELNPKETGALLNKGIALNNLGKYEEALKTFEKMPSTNDYSNSLALFNAGVALSGLGRYDESIAAYSRVISSSNGFSAIYNIACVYSLKKDKVSALRELQKVVQMNEELAKYSKEDKDFDWLWADEDFKKIVNTSDK